LFVAVVIVSVAVPQFPVTVKVNAAGVTVPVPDEAPVTVDATVNVVALGTDVIFTLVKLYPVLVNPVTETTIPFI
jgi:hypothetical protein